MFVFVVLEYYSDFKGLWYKSLKTDELDPKLSKLQSDHLNVVTKALFSTDSFYQLDVTFLSAKWLECERYL